MRLIDADALYPEVRKADLEGKEIVDVRDIIRFSETVEAIPISFIHDWIDQHGTDNIAQLLCDWKIQNSQAYECPKWAIALLQDIDRRIVVSHREIFHCDMKSPFGCTRTRFNGTNFTVKGYLYGDKDWNFKYRDIEISWRESLGEDTKINIDPDEEGFEKKIIEMYTDIIEGLGSDNN